MKIAATIRRSATLLLPNTGPAYDPSRAHLYVVLTDPDQDQCLMAPICTVRKWADRTCLLGPGDHSFFKVLSFVSYAELDIFSVPDLQEEIQKGRIRLFETISLSVFAHICSGITQSSLSPPAMIRYYINQTKKAD